MGFRGLVVGDSGAVEHFEDEMHAVLRPVIGHAVLCDMIHLIGVAHLQMAGLITGKEQRIGVGLQRHMDFMRQQV